MAKEAILRDRLADPINFEPQNESAIEKGALLKLVDERTVSGTVTSGCAIAGICAREKTLNDGEKVAVYRRGIFDMYLSGVATIGDAVVAATEENHVHSMKGKGVVNPVSGMAFIGRVLGTGSTNELIQVDVNIGAGGI